MSNTSPTDNTPPLNGQRQAAASTAASTLVSFRASPDVMKLLDGVIQHMCITRTLAIELCVVAACAHWATDPPEDDAV
jgi:hypothetical protein